MMAFGEASTTAMIRALASCPLVSRPEELLDPANQRHAETARARPDVLASDLGPSCHPDRELTHGS